MQFKKYCFLIYCLSWSCEVAKHKRKIKHNKCECNNAFMIRCELLDVGRLRMGLCGRDGAAGTAFLACQEI